jgi:beta-glucosidase
MLDATKKPVIIALNGGRPRIIERIVDRVKGTSEIYLPGNFRRHRLADILIGKVCPSGTTRTRDTCTRS